MGLDMYLNKKHYVGNKFRKPRQLVKIIIPKDQKKVIFPTSKIVDKRISEIIEEVGCWRKANAIHRWFVENVQNGKDNCEDYYVDKEQLEKLLSLCNKVIKASRLVKGKVVNGQKGTKEGWKDIIEDGMIIENPKVAMELLPTISGFFFGGTNYDQYYIKNIKDTKKMLTELLKEDNGASFYYSSSW